VYNKFKNSGKITLKINLSVITEGRTIAFFKIKMGKITAFSRCVGESYREKLKSTI